MPAGHLQPSRAVTSGQRWNACLVHGVTARAPQVCSPPPPSPGGGKGEGRDHQLFPAISPEPPASHRAASLGGEAGAINHRE